MRLIIQVDNLVEATACYDDLNAWERGDFDAAADDAAPNAAPKGETLTLTLTHVNPNPGEP